MKITRKTRFITMLCAVLMLLSLFMANASASDSAFGNVSTSKYAKVFTLNSSGRTIPFTNSSLTTRGTVTYGASSSSYIDNASDEIYICGVGVTNGKQWAYVSYPTSTRRVYAYVPLEALTTAGTYGHASAVSTGKFYCAKRQGGAASTSYYVDRGDKVYLLARSGGWCQLMYPTSGGLWRIAFAKEADVDRYCSFSANNSGRLVSDTELARAASQYGLAAGSNAYNALFSINTRYAAQLGNNPNGTYVFLFEGVGADASTSVRKNAMCVVVKNGSVVYLNRASSTIPDLPFDPSKNDGTPMPTLKSGVYNFTTVNHRGEYAALNVSSAAVVRFNSRYSYYASTSSGINVHKRSSDTISASRSWVNSAGCQIVGAANNSDYLAFIKAVGIVGYGTNSIRTYTNSVSGKIIIDRTYAHNYLAGIGYPEGAISMIG